MTPPLVWQLARRLWLNQPVQTPDSSVPEWEYIPEGWDYLDQHPEVKGWNVSEVLAVYQEKWPRFVEMVQGTTPLGISHESNLATKTDIVSHNIMITFGYAIALAAQGRQSLTFLDWGGGIGHYYLLSKALLPNITINYHCKDVPVLTNYGQELFPHAHFYADESCLEQTYDFVLVSGSLQFSQDWLGILNRLSQVTGNYLLVTNCPTLQQTPSFVFIQRPYKYGYNTEYLGWCLNRHELITCCQTAGLELVREFVNGHRPLIKNAPEQNEYRGFLFRKTVGSHP
ncbi:hypothetical protein [Neosynechococcus sphagnicola]|nr:hypothetical protein [Neosynechococcus sphagnicola]